VHGTCLAPGSGDQSAAVPRLLPRRSSVLLVLPGKRGRCDRLSAGARPAVPQGSTSTRNRDNAYVRIVGRDPLASLRSTHHRGRPQHFAAVGDPLSQQDDHPGAGSWSSMTRRHHGARSAGMHVNPDPRSHPGRCGQTGLSPTTLTDALRNRRRLPWRQHMTDSNVRPEPLPNRAVSAHGDAIVLIPGGTLNYRHRWPQ